MADSDISLQSADGVIFKVHKAQLSVHSAVFEDMLVSSHDDGEPTQLSEKSDALADLLCFFCKPLYPNLDGWKVAKLIQVGELANKYQAVMTRDVVNGQLLIW